MTNTASTAVIRQATSGDREQVSRLLAGAFHDGPVAEWLVPDEAARREVYLDYFAVWVDHALCHGIVHVTEDLSGAALWYPLIEPMPQPAAGGRLAAACGRWWSRFDMLDATFAEHHPTWPHHYLAFLAVDLQRQGNGIGSALLRYHHAALVDAGLPAYLEASNERNRDLYLRHGYRTTGPFHLSRGGPPIWPMRYDPATPPPSPRPDSHGR